MQEDHVSMGWAAGLKLRRAIDGLTRVLAIEILTAARALDMRDGGAGAEGGLRSSAPISAVRARLRADVEGPGTDRYLAPEIEAARLLVDDGALLAAATAVLPAPLP
jgi:histidine ammonia-lyase